MILYSKNALFKFFGLLETSASGCLETQKNPAEAEIYLTKSEVTHD